MLRRLSTLSLCTSLAFVAACPDPGTSSEDAGSSGGTSGGASSSTGGGGSSSTAGSSAAGTSAAGSTGGTSTAGSGTSSGAGSTGSLASSADASSQAGSSSSDVQTGSSSNPPPAGRTFIWAHTPKDLYKVDSETLEVTLLGTLEFLDENMQVLPNAQLTDLAVAGSGSMWGCSQQVLWEIDAPNLKAYKRAALVERYTGMTFVPVGFLEPDREVLVGATVSDGSLYRIEVATGNTTAIGSYGGGWQTSGDVVAVAGDGMYATVKRSGETTDYLARIDPSGAATIIGPTVGIGALKIYGLGYWNSVLYGFTDEGEMLSINKLTGEGTLLSTRTLRWWGAGVTTLAKVN